MSIETKYWSQQQSITLDKYYGQIVVAQKFKQQYTNKPNFELLRQFKQIHSEIANKISIYHNLSSKYKSKVEHDFLKTFSKIIEKIGQDLIKAEQAYYNIDKQIMLNQKCQNLTSNINFFKNQCTYYKNQLEMSQKQIKKLKDKNLFLIKQNKALEENLFKKVKQCLFYKQRNKKQQKQADLSLMNPQTAPISVHNSALISSFQPSSPAKNNLISISVNKGSLFQNIKKQLNQRDTINITQIIQRHPVSHTKDSNKNKKKAIRVTEDEKIDTHSTQTGFYPSTTRTLHTSHYPRRAK